MRKFGVILFNLTLILALYLVTAVTVRAGPMTSISITPVDPTAGVITDYSISFTPPTSEISSVLIDFSAFGTTGTDMVLSGVSTNIGDYSFGGFLGDPTGVTVNDSAKIITFTGGRTKKNVANTIANAVPGTGLVITNDQDAETQNVTISTTTDSGTFALTIIPPPDIANTPGTWNFGVVDASSSYTTGLSYVENVSGFRITNSTSYAVKITISAGDMTGGDTWLLSDSGAPDATHYTLWAGTPALGDYTIQVTSGGVELVASIAGSGGTQDWGLKLMTPTSITDGVTKSGTVTLTATAA